MNKLESKLKTLRNNFRKIFWVLPEKLREIRQAQEYQNTKTEKFNEYAHTTIATLIAKDMKRARL